MRIHDLSILCALQDLFCLSICGEIWSLKYTDSGADGQHTIICRGHPDSITYYSQLIDLFLEIIRILPHRLNTVLQNGEELGDKILKTVNLYTDTVAQSEEVDLFRIKCIKFICKLKAVTDVRISFYFYSKHIFVIKFQLLYF